ncbi:hypothetical protein BGZ65_002570, partial [Modicella reniformis]
EYGSFDNIKTMKAYLKFLSDTPGAFDGSKTDHTLWFMRKYGGKPGAQAADRMKGKKTDQSDKAITSTPFKRQSPGDESETFEDGQS